MPHVLLATCAALPDLEPEDRPLVTALAARGLDVQVGIWTDPKARWADAPICVIRSTWDYHLQLEAFLAWARRVDGVTRLLNPLDLVAWNGHKSYLRDLAARGIPTIPTTWAVGAAAPTLADVVAATGWQDVVIKPLVSASAHRTLRTGVRDIEHAQSHLEALVADGGAMIQPYQLDVEVYGERSLVYVDGTLSHGVRRTPALAPGVTNPNAYDVVPVTPDEDALGRKVLAALDAPTLYARVDLVRRADGELAVLELELIEPSLYLTRVPGAADRLADAIVARLPAARAEAR